MLQLQSYQASLPEKKLPIRLFDMPGVATKSGDSKAMTEEDIMAVVRGHIEKGTAVQ